MCNLQIASSYERSSAAVGMRTCNFDLWPDLDLTCDLFKKNSKTFFEASPWDLLIAASCVALQLSVLEIHLQPVCIIYPPDFSLPRGTVRDDADLWPSFMTCPLPPGSAGTEVAFGPAFIWAQFSLRHRGHVTSLELWPPLVAGRPLAHCMDSLSRDASSCLLQTHVLLASVRKSRPPLGRSRMDFPRSGSQSGLWYG